MTLDFSPGDLVRARGREWVVVGGGEVLRLRPLSGSERDIEALLPALEPEPVTAATFPPPTGAHPGPREAAQLLRDALRLSLRRGAGPFRSAGRLNFEPRAYQLAPLLMALRQEPVRLLIADDVGIGKTIEAGLILREFLERGEIEKFTVLCPPHLVDQWIMELETKFAIHATAVTAGNAARLEREIQDGESVFDAFEHTVVSLDFIKSPKRLDDFVRACPEMVVVDEAHAAVAGGNGRHHRYDLLRRLAADKTRHLLLLTATPHSGNEDAFGHLLGLLDPAFGSLATNLDPALRTRLAQHFIQRRRADIEAWREPGLFPTRHVSEKQYRLTGDTEAFYMEVIRYCAEVVESEQGDLRQRLAFWGMLALMRCVGSSPAAAARALRTRAALDADAAEAERVEARALDDEDAIDDDLEPGAAVEDKRLAHLISQADALAGDVRRDPKFKALKAVLDELLAAGFKPVIFCRYVATAESIGLALRAAFSQYIVDIVTGALPSDVRADRVVALGANEKRILVATDCLSEGINLQAWFDSVVHYDLSWNPTRQQQREGRVDRYGQKNPEVRTVLMYGENNPVDGAVLKVILRKAQAIEKQTGVRVPLPDDTGSLTAALMSAVLLKAKEQRQLTLDFSAGEHAAAQEMSLAWDNASEREKKMRTIFAQNTLKPEHVIPQWEATRRALGGPADTRRFVERALMRLGSPLTVVKPDGFRAGLGGMPATLKERFDAEPALASALGTNGMKLCFEPIADPNFAPIHRAHPLPAILAESFLESALDDGSADKANDPAVLERCGVWECAGVSRVTTLLLVRLRHRLDGRGRFGPGFAMAEEACAIAFAGGVEAARDQNAFELFDAASSDVPERVRAKELAAAVAALPTLQPQLATYAAARAQALAADHTTVAKRLGSSASVTVTPVTPVDVIGLYVLMPNL
jgi:superfamily II DNA or RNA helicase